MKRGGGRARVGAAVGVWVILAATVGRADSDADGPCTADMVLVTLTEPAGRACVDRFEAHLVRVGAEGVVIGAHPPNEPVGTHRVRAQSSRGALPQAHVSRDDAAAACAEAGKRLCTSAEWLAACRGPTRSRYPYGTRRRAGACNDRGAEPMARIVARPSPRATWGIDAMNDPSLYLTPGSVARTGRHDRCRSEVGTVDMVGNLHEWTAEESGVMRGGYYLDTEDLGEGCEYVSVGHDAKYRDYSTGFRCCADAR